MIAGYGYIGIRVGPFSRYYSTATYPCYDHDPFPSVYQRESLTMEMIRIEFWNWINLFSFKITLEGRRICAGNARCDKEIPDT